MARLILSNLAGGVSSAKDSDILLLTVQIEELLLSLRKTQQRTKQ